MTDLVQLFFQAGNGGGGSISFRREKYAPKGGPNGGDGGSGGNIVLKAVKNRSSLSHLSGVKTIKARAGQSGMSKKKFGSNAQDVIVEVPIGTLVWVLAESAAARRRRHKTGLDLLPKKYVRPDIFERDWEGNVIDHGQDNEDTKELFVPEKTQTIPSTKESGQIVAELVEDGQKVVICQGGFGGRGNTHFKSSIETTPLKAERGSLGERRQVMLELRLLADIGLVGLPSVGKSTLLSVLTSAKPKTAAYHFTTLTPHLGIFNEADQELVIADIPGLIEGASQGKGLGLDFLRHVEHCSSLIFVLALEEAQVMDDSLSHQDKAKLLVDQYQTLLGELAEYSQDLLEKPRLIVVNKLDLYSPELIEVIEKETDKLLKQKPLMISAFKHQGVAELRQALLV
jgi:GTPase